MLREKKPQRSIDTVSIACKLKLEVRLREIHLKSKDPFLLNLQGREIKHKAREMPAVQINYRSTQRNQVSPARAHCSCQQTPRRTNRFPTANSLWSNFCKKYQQETEIWACFSLKKWETNIIHVPYPYSFQKVV